MMKLAFKIAVAAVWVLSLPATSSAQGHYGMAGVPCSQYIKAARASDILFHQASQWLLGYLSGLNAAGGTAAVANLSNDQILKLAGDYCEANPTSNLVSAANASLPRQIEPQTAQKEPQDNSLTLSLDRAPRIKPLLDRR